MDRDRKYKQHGYQDHGRDDRDRHEKPHDRPQEPRPKQDAMGPRTPRMVGSVLRARCTNCGAVLMPGFDPNGKCPKCGLDLHCCKQCLYFDSGAQFECMQPIPERIPKKDARNNCSFFEFRMTVEKDTLPTGYSHSPAPASEAPRPNDARKAFEDLFKK
jgi:hypothetical protein